MNMKRQLLAIAAVSLIAFGAQAQKSSGNITGVAAAGDTIAVQGVGTGFHRDLTVEEAGKWQVRNVPTGNYAVTVSHADGTAEKPKVVSVHAGVTVRIK